MTKRTDAKVSRRSRTPGARSQDDDAKHHKNARAARSLILAQDYVEVIDDLIREFGEARVVDIARRLAVSHVTVNRTLARLRRDKLVRSEKYRSIFLTDAGSALAAEVRARHQIVIAFLEALGVPPIVARRDAEGIEHHVSRETVQAFERYLAARPSKRKPNE